MKNLKMISDRTQTITPQTPIPLYYSIEKKEAYTNPGSGRFHVTNLINPNSPEDIQEVIERWLRM